MSESTVHDDDCGTRKGEACDCTAPLHAAPGRVVYVWLPDEAQYVDLIEDDIANLVFDEAEHKPWDPQVWSASATYGEVIDSARLLEQARRWAAELEAENAHLRAVLAVTTEALADTEGYVGDYFWEKHRYGEDLAAARAALTAVGDSEGEQQ